MSKTSAKLIEATKYIWSKIPESLHDKVYVRTATPGRKSGRCAFDFHEIDREKVAVAVVCGPDGPTDDFYVVPGHSCPQTLTVVVGSPRAKWNPYYCAGTKLLAQQIQQTADFKPSRKLLSRLG